MTWGCLVGGLRGGPPASGFVGGAVPLRAQPGVPALDGAIVLAGDDRAEETIGALASRRPRVAALPRSEPVDGRPISVRGGYLVDVDDVPDRTRDALRDGYAVFWLEPVSP